MKNRVVQRISTGMLILFLLSSYVVSAAGPITVVLYYSSSCGSCKNAVKLVDAFALNYSDQIVFIKKEVGSNTTNRNEWKSYGFTYYPSIVINNETLVPKDNITEANLENLLTMYITQQEQQQTQDLFVLIGLGVGIVVVIGVVGVVVLRKQKKKE